MKGSMTDQSETCISERCKKARARGLYCVKCCRRFDIQRSKTRGHEIVPHPSIHRDGRVTYSQGEAVLAWHAYSFDAGTYLAALAEALDDG